MIKNYFKIAWRNLWKNKAVTALNLGGLTISLASCLIIFLWVNDELKYDRAGENADRVYRVGLTLVAKDQPDKYFAVTAPPLANVLFKDFPEIEKTVRLQRQSMLVGYRNEHFNANDFYFVDSTFFEVFDYPLLKGDPHSVLTTSRSVVISESMANKYFGNDDPIGKTITYNDTILSIVTGVAKDLPPTNHFHFDLVAAANFDRGDGSSNWWNDSYYTYVLLKQGRSAQALGAKMADIMDKYNAEQNKAIGFRGLHFLQPIRSIHLHSDLRAEIEANGKISTLRIFVGIAIFLLIVACINYINLTTATSFKRAKEIGMRKVSGAGLKHLVAQFLSESIVISLLAVLLAAGLAQLSLPFFNRISGTSISLKHELTLSFVGYILGAAVFLGILAGLYPSLYLAKVDPLRAFRKNPGNKSGLLSFRKALVIFQFTLSIMLIIATFIALQQLKYMQSKDVGLDKEQVVGIQLRDFGEINAIATLKKEFAKNSGVLLSSASSSTPGRQLSNITVLPEGFPDDQVQTMNTLIVDYDFINTYKIRMLAGRPFERNFGDDSSGFILNETAVRELGWKTASNAINKKFNWGLGKQGRIIGVVKDFNFNSLQQKLTPVVMHILPASTGWYGFISVRVDGPDKKKVIQSLEAGWKKIIPAHPFDYFFVDQDYDKQYKTEQQLGSLSMLFSGLTIFISCLGLLGLVMVSVSQRTKEIGVRKVLGASVVGITALLSKDFLKLVFVAILIASPLAGWLMNLWLQDYAYRIPLNAWIFLFAGIAAIIIAIATIGLSAGRAARANPVKSLRTE